MIVFAGASARADTYTETLPGYLDVIPVDEPTSDGVLDTTVDGIKGRQARALAALRLKLDAER